MTKSKTTLELLGEFDDAARDWGWKYDCGCGNMVDQSLATYNETKDRLIRRIKRLEKVKREG